MNNHVWKVSVGEVASEDKRETRHYNSLRNAQIEARTAKSQYPDEPVFVWRGTWRDRGYWSWDAPREDQP